jgi:murein DD-endopeptidase MepM/ murein hydrolase activator NlpD
MRIKHRAKTVFVLFALIVGAYFLIDRSNLQKTVQTATVIEASKPVLALDEFGIAASLFEVEEHTIKRNQTFSQILSEYGTPAETITTMAEKAKPVFDVRLLQAGKPYRVYRTASGVSQLVYQDTPVRYIVFDLEKQNVREGKRPVEVKRQTVGGRIRSSLYGALEENGIQPALAVKLAEIYAWQIDFFRLQHGDAFKVTYEEEFVDGESVGIRAILASRFTHAGEDFYAFRFEQDGRVDYFDENGNGLRKAMLKSPLEFGRLTSGYSLNRFHPVQKRYKAHLGTDYAAPTGTPIHATGDGVVLEASRTKGNGIYVKIRHNSTYTTAYLHMSRIANGIKPGVHVKQNQVIGYVGSTGLATGPHVCYRLWKNGVQIDSRKENFPPSEPVLAQHRLAFFQTRDSLIAKLHENPLLPQFVLQGLSTTRTTL